MTKILRIDTHTKPNWTGGCVKTKKEFVHMTIKVRSQLSVMMFIEFFIWGVWYVTMGTYLNKIGFSGIEIGSAYSTTCWAAIISPFFVGMIADRFFSGEKVLGIMHIVGAALLYWASQVTAPGQFFWVLLLYTLCYMPTIALVNSVSFHQMENPGKEFPNIRVLGTIGWIVAGVIIGLMKVEDTNMPMKLGALASLLLGVYCFFLPHTPPKAKGQKVTIGDVIGIKTLQLMKERSFAIFILSALLICIPLAFYYSFTNLFLNELGVVNAAGKMTLGQASEVIFMIIMPFMFARLGVKKMLIIGMLAWAARYILFAFGDPAGLQWMLYGGIILHGVCYDFFFVTGFIYVDREAPKEIQSSAQGFIALITYGVGMLIGSWVSGWIVDVYKVTNAAGNVPAHLWKNIWMVPAAMAVFIVIAFALLFKDKKSAAVPGAAA